MFLTPTKEDHHAPNIDDAKTRKTLTLRNFVKILPEGAPEGCLRGGLMNEERQRLIERSVTFPNEGEPDREEVKKIAKEFQESERCIYPTVTKSGMGGCTGSRQKLDKLRDGGLITAEERTAMRRGWPGGRLNPAWVEWLMGWPIGWTELKPLETVKSPLAPPQPS